MKSAKLIVNDTTIDIPINEYLFDSLTDNSERLNPLSSDIDNILCSLFPANVQTGAIIVGDAELEFKADAYLLDSIAATARINNDLKFDETILEHLADRLRKTIPTKWRPPTSRQVSFATKIAMTLGMDLPASALKSTDACSTFIDAYQEEFQIESRKSREFVSWAQRAVRWFIAEHFQQKGCTLSEIAHKLGVKNETTVTKYLNTLKTWKEQFEQKPKEQRNLTIFIITDLIEHDYIELGPIEISIKTEAPHLGGF